MQNPSPHILFFPTNGSGMGHLNRCLAYARRLRGKAVISFFSLVSALEIIEDMGFAADYFVSPFWSSNSSYDWNWELAIRFGLFLERTRPQVVVFDGTWPFQGFMVACRNYRRPLKLVWSNRGLLKNDVKKVPVDPSLFDLIIEPGELGSFYSEDASFGNTRKITVPPVTLLENGELLGRADARRDLCLDPEGRYALFSLGPGNFKDMSGIGGRLIDAFHARGYRIVWACAPISVRDAELPPTVTPLAVYPLVRYIHAFDCFVGAAGYNTCCEIAQARIPSLFIPNTLVADDQFRRALLVAEHIPAVVSPCESVEETEAALCSLLQLAQTPQRSSHTLDMNGAALAADAILNLVDGGR